MTRSVGVRERRVTTSYLVVIVRLEKAGYDDCWTVGGWHVALKRGAPPRLRPGLIVTMRYLPVLGQQGIMCANSVSVQCDRKIRQIIEVVPMFTGTR